MGNEKKKNPVESFVNNRMATIMWGIFFVVDLMCFMTLLRWNEITFGWLLAWLILFAGGFFFAGLFLDKLTRTLINLSDILKNFLNK